MCVCVSPSHWGWLCGGNSWSLPPKIPPWVLTRGRGSVSGCHKHPVSRAQLSLCSPNPDPTKKKLSKGGSGTTEPPGHASPLHF